MPAFAYESILMEKNASNKIYIITNSNNNKKTALKLQLRPIKL